jgi:hypothetical protein
VFNKVIPASIVSGSGPQRAKGSPDARKAAIASLPPSFRTAHHQVVENSDHKRPPTFSTGYAETNTVPGRRVEAADRNYVVGPAGELRRITSNRGRHQRKPGKGEVKAKTRHAERVEAQLAAVEGARRRKRALRVLAAAERTKANATTLQQQARAAVKGGSGG